MPKTRANMLSTAARQLVGKSQVYALLVDSSGNAILDSEGNEQIAELEAVGGRLKVDIGAAAVGGKIPVVTEINSVSLTDLETTNAPPLTGLKTVIATAAEVFAGASAKSNRRMLFIKNTDPVLRCKVGASGVSQQTGTSLEPGAAVEIKFDPGIYVPIFAISEGASIKVEVWEV
ncbi:hypothetical protein DEAC_c14390 [Desulfosporosinus acididurans]|uniref:Uncharacterized protein n=1 Tax=Desulfosporosinus acididurans TaxID=476652 RepID=A0A0J1IQ03_9FIRM|nr:hypothetical protein [Desulfosporosinus acididurans]KLU66771.1 hypothetical protein DEAC_c14390 [Desulfosporosinus acididurans]